MKGRKPKNLNVEEIITLYNNGATVAALSRIYNVSRQTIYTRFEERGVDLYGNRRKKERPESR